MYHCIMYQGIHYVLCIISMIYNIQTMRKKQDIFQKYKTKKKPVFSGGDPPVNQYKRCLVQTQNVFYQDRPAAKKLKLTKLSRNILAIFLCFLATTYFGISQIHLYNGICPAHANCAVFIHCHSGYELKENICVVQQHILDTADSLLQQRIFQLQLQYGQQDCISQENKQNVRHYYGDKPSFNLMQVINEIQSEEKYLLGDRMEQYLTNIDNQNTVQFQIRKGQRSYDILVSSAVKKYSWGCWLKIQSKKMSFWCIVFVAVLGVIILYNIILKRKRQSRAKVIYEWLRDQTKKHTTINITQLMIELQQKFGTFNQDLWDRINKIRVKQGEIVYLESGDLFWSMIKQSNL